MENGESSVSISPLFTPSLTFEFIFATGRGRTRRRRFRHHAKDLFQPIQLAVSVRVILSASARRSLQRTHHRTTVLYQYEQFLGFDLCAVACGRVR